MKTLIVYNQGEFPWSIFRVDTVRASSAIRAGTTPFMNYDLIRDGIPVATWSTYKGSEKRGHEHFNEVNAVFNAAQVKTPKFNLGEVSPGDIRESKSVRIAFNEIIADGSGATVLPDWTEQAFLAMERAMERAMDPLPELQKFPGVWTAYTCEQWKEAQRARKPFKSEIVFYGTDWVMNYSKN